MGSGARASELLRAAKEGAEGAYYCRKSCKHLRIVLEQIDSRGADGFVEDLEEAKVVVEACGDGAVRPPAVARIWSKYMMSSWIQVVAQRIALRCGSDVVMRRALRELRKLTVAAAGQQEMAKLGRLVPEAVEREDAVALRDAYHRWASNDGGEVLLPDFRLAPVRSTPKASFGEDAWGLFCLSAFDSDAAPEELEGVARAVCEACAGEPLRLQVVGSAMAGKRRVEDWRATLRQLEDPLSDPLRISFDELDAVTKKCFLYFAAFSDRDDGNLTPRPVRFDDMFLLWHGVELLGVDEDDARDEAWLQWGILAARSLIEMRPFGGAVLHPLVREFASRECEPEFLLLPNQRLTAFPILWTTQTLSAELVSLVDNELRALPDALRAPRLRSLHLRENLALTAIPDGFLRSLSATLQVLDLSRTSLDRLPDDLGDLAHLVYLLLANCKNLTELPRSIGSLHNLKYLVVTGSHKLAELPEEIGDPRSLKYLTLRDCHGITGPLPASIGELQHLEYLDLYHCSNLESVPREIRNLTSLKVLKLPYDIVWRKVQAGYDEAAGLDDIACLVNLKTLQIPEWTDWCSDSSPITLLPDVELEPLSSSILAIQGLEWLELRHFFVADTTPSLPELRMLALMNARGMAVPRWLEGCRHLTSLMLHSCAGLRELPALDTLQDLEELYIYECHKLRSVPSSFTRRNAFPSLVRFSCVRCRKLNCAFPEIESADAMPKLQTLELDEQIQVSARSQGILAHKKLIMKSPNHWQDSNMLNLQFDIMTPPSPIVPLDLDTKWL